jgi:hypothetical protein
LGGPPPPPVLFFSIYEASELITQDELESYRQK